MRIRIQIKAFDNQALKKNVQLQKIIFIFIKNCNFLKILIILYWYLFDDSLPMATKNVQLGPDSDPWLTGLQDPDS
jgi:hypothetical protein